MALSIGSYPNWIYFTLKWNLCSSDLIRELETLVFPHQSHTVNQQMIAPGDLTWHETRTNLTPMAQHKTDTKPIVFWFGFVLWYQIIGIANKDLAPTIEDSIPTIEDLAHTIKDAAHDLASMINDSASQMGIQHMIWHLKLRIWH